MPSGPPDLHEKWCERADDGMSGDGAAMQFLKAAGYRLTRRWDWIARPNHTPTDEESEAIFYLMAEWDFGGLARNPPEDQ